MSKSCSGLTSRILTASSLILREIADLCFCTNQRDTGQLFAVNTVSGLLMNLTSLSVIKIDSCHLNQRCEQGNLVRRSWG